MQADLVHRYIRDARQAYRGCLSGLDLSDPSESLSALLRAAKSGEVERAGQVTTASGCVYQYRVHGAGYTFKEKNSGKVIHFDVMPVGGTDRVRFSPWKLCQYASSVGEDISEAAAASGLRELSSREPSVVHVLDGPFDFYYYNAG